MHLCVLDHDGNLVCDKTLASRAEAFLRAVAPFGEGLVVGVECMFAWSWLADLSGGCPRVEPATNGARLPERAPVVLKGRHGERESF
jgi:hypothetical protein